MSPAGRSELADRVTISKVPLAPGCGVAFGLPFLAIGAGITWFAVHQHLLAAEPDEAPWWVLGSIGLVFAGAGLAFVAGGVAGALQRLAAERRRRAYPAEPWRADFAWDRRYAHDVNTASSIVGSLVVLAGLCLFLAPFHWWALGDGPRIMLPVILLFDLLPAAVVVLMGMAVVHRIKFGRPRLLLDRFPFFLGEELAVRLVAPRALRRCHVVRATLRCVQEEFTRDGDSSRVAAYEVYQDSAGHAELRDVIEDGTLPFRFPLPADGQETRLGHRPPRYWEIEVDGTAMGIDFSRRFLVPVYKRRASA